jgi:ATP-dependent Clp protease ATP-binding subunit ClpC
MNRIDATIVFHALSKDHIKEIVDLEINKVCERLSEYNTCLRLTPEAREYLATRGYDAQLGARPLRRIIQTEVEDSLSEELLAGRLQREATVVVDLEAGQLVFRTEHTAEELPVAGSDGEETPRALESILP